MTAQHVFVTLLRCEMRRGYPRVPGGYIWTLLEPVILVSLLTIGFSWVLRHPPLGTSFTLFFATGFGLFTVFQRPATALGLGFQLLKKRAYQFWPEALLARAALNAVVSVIVALFLGAGALVLIDPPTRFEPTLIALALGLTLVVGLSLGILNCAIFAIMPIWRPLWSIASRLLFFASGVLFIPESLPQAAQNILAYNPLVHTMGLLRQGIYSGYSPRFNSGLYAGTTGLILLVLGLFLLRLTHPVPRAARRRISL